MTKAIFPRFLVTIIFVIIIQSQGFSIINFNAECQKAYSKMTDLDLKTAMILTNQEKKINPQNLAPQFIEIYIQFLDLVLNERALEYEKHKTKVEYLIKKLNLESSKNPYKEYLKADLYLQVSIINAFQKSQFSAMTALRNAFLSIKQNHKSFPKFSPNLKLMGIMNITLGSIPADYNWILSIMGMTGSVKEGLKQLYDLVYQVENNPTLNWLQTESLLIYTFMNNNFSEETSKARKQSNLQQKIDSLAAFNPFLCYASAATYRKSGNNELVIAQLEKYKTPQGYQHLYFLDLQRAESYLYKLDIKSIYYFQRYIDNYPGKMYKKAAYQKIAWLYLIQNDDNNYKKHIELLKISGSEQSEDDKKALKEAKSQAPNRYLLKSQLLFDGGYYEEAVRVFQLHNPKIVLKTEKDILEYNYRMGRIYHEWGKQKQAIEYYKITIEKGKNKNYYFAANAALKLGEIYEKNENKSEAKKMYELCLSMEFDEYKNGINQKAKAGLNRIQ